MKRILAVLVLLSLAVPAMAIENMFSVDLSSGTDMLGYASIFGVDTGGREDPSGDTFTVGILTQDAADAFFISDISPSTHTFDGSAEFAGNNLTYPANLGDTFSVIEAFTDLGATELIQVEVTALNAAGAPEPWVPTGAVGPAGPFTAWRLDVGSNAAGDDKISWTPNPGFTVVDSGFTGFDSMGTPVGTFTLSLDSSDATGVSGVGVVGLGGADIAGFDLASIQLFWEVEKVPEPASAALISLGGLALMALRRRRK